MCNGAPFRVFKWPFSVLFSAVSGSKRVLGSRTDALDVDRVAVNDQIPTLAPSLYPGSTATDPRPCVFMDAIWRAEKYFPYDRIHAINGEVHF